jgi:hypothetical protein
LKSSSAEINKVLRRTLSPLLRQSGFDKVDPRNGWAFKADCIWVFSIRAVGSYFAGVTGWPASSFCAWLGVYYTFIPEAAPIKTDQSGRLLPAEYRCHMRSHLSRGIPQAMETSRLSNPPERRRTDIWWLDPAGSNAEEVASDLSTVFVSEALPWFCRCTDLAATLSTVEAERDCFNKFVLASYLAHKLFLPATESKYRALAEKEAARIELPVPPFGWFPL